MKSNELGAILRAYGEALGAAESTLPAHEVSVLSEFFERSTDKVRDVLGRLRTNGAISTFARPRANRQQLLRALRSLLAAAKSKSAVSDLDDLIAFLADCPDVDLSRTTLPQKKRARASTKKVAAAVADTTASVPPVRSRKRAAAPDPERVEEYRSRLEAALRDESLFRSVYADLSNAPKITAADLRELAKKFAATSARGRDDALKKIWSRHQTLQSYIAKGAATAGRTAA